MHFVKQNLVLLPGLLCDEVLWEGQVGGLADCAQCWIPPALAETTVAEMAARVLREAPFESFALAGNRREAFGEVELFKQGSRQALELVRADGEPPPGRREAIEGFRHARKRPAAPDEMAGIVIDEPLRQCVEPGFVRRLGERPGEHGPRSMTHHRSGVLQRDRLEPFLGEDRVEGRDKVARGIDKGPVEVEDKGWPPIVHGRRIPESSILALAARPGIVWQRFLPSGGDAI